MDITLFFERPEVIRFGCMNGSKCGDWLTFGVGLKWLNNPKFFGISFFSTSSCCLLHLLCYNTYSGLSCSATHFTNGWEQIQLLFICVLWRLNNIILYYFKKKATVQMSSCSSSSFRQHLAHKVTHFWFLVAWEVQGMTQWHTNAPLLIIILELLSESHFVCLFLT